MLADLSGEKPQMNMNALYKLTLGLYILGCRTASVRSAAWLMR